ncbi:hypothetical protein K432DRAFT_468508, partial [Lepidopterella palustris CBS 459.81]
GSSRNQVLSFGPNPTALGERNILVFRLWLQAPHYGPSNGMAATTSLHVMQDQFECIKIDGEPVKILVGAKSKSAYVHDPLIRAHSKFFGNAPSGNWRESQKRCFRLPEDYPETFRLYLHWVYSRHVSTGNGDTSAASKSPKLIVSARSLLTPSLKTLFSMP